MNHTLHTHCIWFIKEFSKGISKKQIKEKIFGKFSNFQWIFLSDASRSTDLSFALTSRSTDLYLNEKFISAPSRSTDLDFALGSRTSDLPNVKPQFLTFAQNLKYISVEPKSLDRLVKSLDRLETESSVLILFHFQRIYYFETL
jgi:hypothetical protein